ncbi:MAG: hypothetical protein DME22_12355 [Verrucomicrobia bacterium]|nr:MAG: hypothetical protein DME22_12355 [Verrucomicrobiota bacterium]PYJ97079.1 MAG: hypothetical protein DME23_17415 [Verrucomicrobiota bacterium]
MCAATNGRTTSARPARDEQLRRFPFRRLPDFSAAALSWKIVWKRVSKLLRKTVSQRRLPAQGDKRPSDLKSDAPRIFFVPIFGTRPHQIGEQPGGVPSSSHRTLDTIFCRAARRTRFERLPHAFAEG